MRCQTAQELRTFSRSPEVGTKMGGGQEKRSSRWGVPLAVVLLARASCYSLGLSLDLLSPLSQLSKPSFTLGLLFVWLSSEMKSRQGCTHMQARMLFAVMGRRCIYFFTVCIYYELSAKRVVGIEVKEFDIAGDDGVQHLLDVYQIYSQSHKLSRLK